MLAVRGLAVRGLVIRGLVIRGLVSGAGHQGAGHQGAGHQGAGHQGAGHRGGRQGAGHLAFAAGPHFCLGAPLARLEAATALNAFARRVTAPELDGDGLHYKPNFNLRGPDRLLIRTAGTTPPAQPQPAG